MQLFEPRYVGDGVGHMLSVPAVDHTIVVEFVGSACVDQDRNTRYGRTQVMYTIVRVMFFTLEPGI
jgi:hypothetical protein